MSSDDDDYDPTATTVNQADLAAAQELAAIAQASAAVHQPQLEGAQPVPMMPTAQQSLVEVAAASAVGTAPSSANATVDRSVIAGDNGQTIFNMKRVVLSGHRGAVLALDLDSTGNILVSGGKDGQLMMWDFPERTKAMQAAAEDPSKSIGLHPTRTLTPFPDRIQSDTFNPIVASRWSARGTYVVVCEDGDRPLIVKRNGSMADRCVRGQRGLLNPAKGKGHAAAVIACDTSELDDKRFACFSGLDRAARLWDVDRVTQESVGCFLHGDGPGSATAGDVLTCGALAAGTRGELVLTGGNDGLVMAWDARQQFRAGKPALRMDAGGASVVGVAAVGSSGHVVARTEDSGVFLFDARATGKASLDSSNELPGLSLATFGDNSAIVSGGVATEASREARRVWTVTGSRGVGGVAGGHLVATTFSNGPAVAGARAASQRSTVLLSDANALSVTTNRASGVEVFAGSADGAIYSFHDASQDSSFGAWLLAWQEARVARGASRQQQHPQRPTRTVGRSRSAYEAGSDDDTGLAEKRARADDVGFDF